MRKSILDQSSIQPQEHPGDWLPIEEMCSVEVTSEDPDFPIENALVPGKGSRWRAARGGTQVIRLIFDKPIALRRIRLEFAEDRIARTQEFALRWRSSPQAPFKEILRQQWNFSPQGAPVEVEDYQVSVDGVEAVELEVRPDLNSDDVVATLSSWRMA